MTTPIVDLTQTHLRTEVLRHEVIADFGRMQPHPEIAAGNVIPLGQAGGHPDLQPLSDGERDLQSAGTGGRMPRKIRELEADLARVGFKREPGKGSHRKWRHPNFAGSVTISGQLGNDAKHYQEERVQAAIAKVKGKNDGRA